MDQLNENEEFQSERSEEEHIIDNRSIQGDIEMELPSYYCF